MIPQFRNFSWRPTAAAVVGVLMHTALACNGTAAETPAAAAAPAAPGAASSGSAPTPAPGNPAVAAAPAAPAAPKVDPSKFPEVVARVNGTAIARQELLSAAASLRPLAARAGKPSDTPEFYRDVLEELVSAELMYQEAVKQGVAATEEEVDARLGAMTARFPSEAELDKALAAEGLDRAKMEKELRETMVVQKFVETRIAPEAKVDEPARRAFYDANKAKMEVPERVRASHVLVAFPPNATPEQKQETRKEAEAVLGKLRVGADFAAVAAESSDDPGSKAKGGELPWLGKGQTVKPFEDVAFSLEPGKLSDLVETQFGYHVIKVHEHKQPSTPSFEEAQGQINEMLQQEKLRELVQGRVEALKGKAKIEILI